MKIVFLNTWGGRITEPLIQFFRNHQDVDVFCLQEVYSNAHGKDLLWTDAHLDLMSDIKNTLVDYDYIFHPSLEDWWGLSIFFKKNLSVTNHGEFFVHKQKRYNLELEKNGRTAKNVQFLTCEVGDKKLTILNFHGLWNGQGKEDTEDRLKQSENIIAFIKTLDHPFILGGDFNLSPNTQSLKMFEDIGLKNLIKEYGITSTRTSYYTKENKFADYIFVSDGINVKNFRVMPEEVSDHATLFVEIDF